MSSTITLEQPFDGSKKKKHSNSLWADGWRRLKKNKVSVASAWIIIVTCLVGLFAEWIAPHPFDEQYIENILQPPGGQFLLGTDNLGRDLLSRLIYGARMSMAVGILTAIISLIFGTLYGSISGWVGGKVDSLMMRVIDILYSIPTLVLLILMKVIFDSIVLFENPELRALTGILAALSVVGWVTLARVVRGQVLQVKQMAYVESAQALGANGIWIVIRHVFPNILGPIIVLLTFQIPSNILYESFLSFLGLGLQPPYSSWGVLANEGWKSLRTYPHLMIAPGVALFVTMLAFNLFGDGLRDAFDPQMKGR